MENIERSCYSNLNSTQKLRETASDLQYKNQYTFLNNTRDSNMFQRYTVQLNGIIGPYRSSLPSIHKPHTNRSSYNRVDQKIKELQNIVKQKIRQDQNSLSLHQTQRQSMQRPYCYEYQNKSPQIQFVPIYRYSSLQRNPYPPQTIRLEVKQNRQIVKPKIQQSQIKLKEKSVLNIQPIQKTNMAKKRIKKLKIYVYVVYFCIYFPHYSKKFAEKRRNYIQSYHKQCNLPEIKLMKCLEKIDLYKIKKQSLSVKQAEAILDWEQLTNTALTLKQRETQTKISANDLICRQISNCTLTLLEEIRAKISQPKKNKLDEFYLKLSLCMSNNSIIMNDTYYEQQAHIMIANKNGNLLKISKEHQIQLILIRVVYKLIIEKFLENIMKNQNYIQHIKDKHQIHKYQILSMETLIKNMKLCLFIIYKEIYTKFISKYGKKSNFIEFAKKNEINFINKKCQDDYLYKLVSDVKFATLFRKKQIEQFQQFMKRNQQLQVLRQSIKQKLFGICESIHDQIYDKKYEHYQLIKSMTLLQKNIISNKPAITSLQMNKQKMNQKRKNIKFQLYQKLCKVGKSKQSVCNTQNKNNPWENNTQLKKIQNKMGKLAQNKINQFTLDTVNLRYRNRKQDQIRQRFRNILNKK